MYETYRLADTNCDQKYFYDLHVISCYDIYIKNTESQNERSHEKDTRARP